MAFLARSGAGELFTPCLLRRCESLGPQSMGGEEVYEVVSPYGYPGLLLRDAPRRSPRFAREAMNRVGAPLRGIGAGSAFLRVRPLLGHGLGERFWGVFSTS